MPISWNWLEIDFPQTKLLNFFQVVVQDDFSTIIEGSKVMGNGPLDCSNASHFMQIPPLQPHIYSNGQICLGKLN